MIFPPTSVGFGSKLEMKVHRLLLSFSLSIMPVLHIVIMCDGSGLHGLLGLLVDAVFIPSHSASPSLGQHHPSLRSVKLPQRGLKTQTRFLIIQKD